MAFDNATNRGRVEKMCETLDLIEKSARSNGASTDDLADLLQPLTTRLTVTADAGSAVQTVRQADLRIPPHAALADLVREAPIDLLPQFLATFLTRLDDHFHEHPPARK